MDIAPRGYSYIWIYKSDTVLQAHLKRINQKDCNLCSIGSNHCRYLVYVTYYGRLCFVEIKLRRHWVISTNFIRTALMCRIRLNNAYLAVWVFFVCVNPKSWKKVHKKWEKSLLPLSLLPFLCLHGCANKNKKRRGKGGWRGRRREKGNIHIIWHKQGFYKVFCHFIAWNLFHYQFNRLLCIYRSPHVLYYTCIANAV